MQRIERAPNEIVTSELQGGDSTYTFYGDPYKAEDCPLLNGQNRFCANRMVVCVLAL